MRLFCVIDDVAEAGSPFRAEHGLSFVIESGGRRLLFDTGQSGTALLHNLGLLGVDPMAIDALALSHAHYDHTGGLPVLLGCLRPGIPLYAHPDLFRRRFALRDGGPKYVGLSLSQEVLASRLALRLGAGPQEILPGIWTTGEIVDRPEAEGKSGSHRMVEGDALIADAYRDDMALVLQLAGHLILLCGCCHAGLLNTLAHVRRAFPQPIAAIVGGLHLADARPEDLGRLCGALAALPALRRIYPSHCTGEGAVAALARALGPAVVAPCPAGTRIEPEEWL